MSSRQMYSPEPNILEQRFADYLGRRGAGGDAQQHLSDVRLRAITRVCRWAVGLSALAGLVSGGLIGGAEIWLRGTYLDGMGDAGWRETLPYWAAFYAFAGVISAVEIVALYALALGAIARLTHHAGLTLSPKPGESLFAHSLARAALEFPSPQVRVYGIDPYAHVANWKLTAINIAYKLKVGVSSFVLRVFLRRVAARMAIRGMVPLIAGPLYALWNAYIIARIMAEARLRIAGPFVVDAVMSAWFTDAAHLDEAEKDVILHAAGEMLTRGRDAHPNQIHLMARLNDALGRGQDVRLDWDAMRGHLSSLDADGKARLLDMLTASCIIGTRLRREQMQLLSRTCHDCGAELRPDRVMALRQAIARGDRVTPRDLSDARRDADDTSCA